MPATRYYPAREKPAEVVRTFDDADGDGDLAVGSYAVGVSRPIGSTVFFHTSDEELTDTVLASLAADRGIPISGNGEVSQLVDIEADTYLYVWTIAGGVQVYFEEQA